MNYLKKEKNTEKRDLSNNYEQEVMSLMNKIEYGWVDVSGKKHNSSDEDFSDNYRLQSPTEIINSRVGVCWDQVELERFYFNDWKIQTYFIIHYDENKCPTHTFLTYEKNQKYYWFEHSWAKFRGIYEYETKKDLLRDVKNKFIKFELNNHFGEDNLFVYEYEKPQYHINVEEFYRHCESGKIIKI